MPEIEPLQILLKNPAVEVPLADPITEAVLDKSVSSGV